MAQTTALPVISIDPLPGPFLKNIAITHYQLFTKAPHLFYDSESICLSLSKKGYSPMARHKKIERKKELDRQRKRRKERLKDRIREAKAAAK